MVMRFVVTGLMCVGAIYYIGSAGAHPSEAFDWSKQIKYLAKVFGNTTFIFIYHHSISGIIYPVRPQKEVKKMFLYSNIIGTSFLVVEAILAYMAFGALDSFCVADPNDPASEKEVKFPCRVSDLYNENFLNLPGIGQICNFYPLLNIAAVPVLNITLRNNLLDVLPVRKWLRTINNPVARFLVQDHRDSVKGVWSIILSFPVFIVVLLTRDVQTMITYTGGFCGAFIMLVFPTMLA
jgi:hypothetical protein